MKLNSKRVEFAKKNYYSIKPEICPHRAVIITDSYKKNENQPMQLKRAMALSDVLTNMPIYIQDYELIVGNIGSKPRSAPIFPEFTVHYLEKDLNELDQRPGEKFVITDDSKEKIFNVLNYWEGKTVRDRNLSMLPKETIDAGEDGAAVIDSEWILQNGDGHLAVDYPNLISFGLRDNIDFCKRKLETMDLTEDPENIYKKLFYQSVIITNEAVINFAHRYAELAENLAKGETSAERKKELLKIVETSRHIPEYPARTFYEAIQSLFFIQSALQVETNGHSISIGRFDQFMYPFYVNDIKRGILTDDDALELIQLFRIKLGEVTKLRSWSCTDYFRGHPMFQNLTLGGVTPDYEDASNDVSFLFLDATESLSLIQPSLTARISKVTSEKFLNRCAEVISHGGGFPALFNDEIIIPSLTRRGISEIDARNYCMVGCVEPTVPGKWGGRNGACFFNLTKALEIALNDGKDPRTGIQLKKGNGDLSTFKSFDEVLESYKIQVDYYIKHHVIKDNVQDYAWEELIPTPLCSSLVSDCLERGRELKKGGAIYDFTGGQTGNVANVANSLAAIKKLVFEEKVITGKELMEALQNDFAGPRGEEIQNLLINKAPKFGNDIDYVDEIAKWAFSVFLRGVDGYKNTRFGRGPIGGGWHPSTASVSANVPMGHVVGATPDGRKAYTPLADVESAAHGTDTNGPTAMIKSAAKLEHIYMSGGSLLNLRVSPSTFR